MKPASIRSDIYSLGVVLYQLLVGDFMQPVTGDWANEIQDPLLREDLQHCLAGKPQDRFAGADQLAKHLRALPERRAELARREAEQAERGRLHRQAAQRRKIMIVAATVAALFLVLAIALGFGMRKAEHARQVQRRYA